MSAAAFLLAAAALAAGLVKGFTGFGGALVMAPLFALVLSPLQTLGAVAAINVASGWQMLGPSWRAMQREMVLPMAAASAMATPLGVAAVMILDPTVSRRMIGASVAASGLALLCGWRRSHPAGLGGAVSVGMLSGLLNGMAGVGGPPAAFWLLAGREAAQRNRAGLVVFVALTQVATAAFAAWAGALDGSALVRAMWLAPLHIVGTLAGGRLFHAAPEMIVRLLVVGLIVAIGLASSLR